MNCRTKKLTIMAAILVIVVAGIGIFAFLSGGAERELKNQLDLGYKYLAEMDYEQAIASFKKAVEMDPVNADAYLGMVDAYVGKDDLEAAKSALETAIIRFEENGLNGDHLQSKLDEIVAELERIEAERIESVIKETVKEAYFSIYLTVPNFKVGEVWTSKTYDELLGIWEPHLGIMEEGLSYCIDSDSGMAEYYCKLLATIYKVLNRSDDLLSIRIKLYELTGDEEYNPQGHSDEFCVYDGLGNIVVYADGSTCEYNGTQPVRLDSGDGEFYILYEYDDGGRISSEETHFPKNWYPGSRGLINTTYVYNENIIYQQVLDGLGEFDDDRVVYTTDEYGRVIHVSTSFGYNPDGTEQRTELDYDHSMP